MAKGQRKHTTPWDEIKRAFVEGKSDDSGKRYYPTQRQLCEQYGIAVSSIGTRASKEQWCEQREIFASKVEAATSEKVIEAISDAGSKFDLTCFNAARKASELLTEKLDIATRNADVDEMAKLSTALKNFQFVGRVALGLATDISKTSGSLSVTAKDLTRMEEDG